MSWSMSALGQKQTYAVQNAIAQVRFGPEADIGSLGKRQSDRLLRTSSQLNCSNPICEYVLSGRTPDLLSALWRRDAFSWRRTGKQHSRSIYFRVRQIGRASCREIV